jgi:hypothetical protein
MRWSRERLYSLADRIVSDLVTTPGVSVKFADDDRVRTQLRTEVFRVLEDEAKLDDSVDEEVRRTLSSYARPVPEGSTEWEVLYQKTRSEMLRRRLRL